MRSDDTVRTKLRGIPSTDSKSSKCHTYRHTQPRGLMSTGSLLRRKTVWVKSVQIWSAETQAWPK